MDCARSTWGCHSEQSRLCKYLRPKHLQNSWFATQIIEQLWLVPFANKLMLFNPQNWAIMTGSFCKYTRVDSLESQPIITKLHCWWGVYLIHSTVYMFWDIDCSNSCGEESYDNRVRSLLTLFFQASKSIDETTCRLDLNLCQPQNYSSNRSHNHRTTTIIKKAQTHILSIRA